MMRIEKAYHWFSISCMAAAVGMVCAGHTVLEPALHTGGELVSLLYWSVCSASVIATATLAYLALASAERRLRTLATVPARLSAPTKQHAKT
jgi:hypothetical protein